MAVSNVQRLTRGDRKYAAKKKAASVPEVKFDQDSRKDFLTGFHKRKLARQAEAKRKAEEMNRAERIAERQRIRDERKAAINMGMERLKEAESIIENSAGSNGSARSKTRFAKDNSDSEEEQGEQPDEFNGFEDGEEASGILKRQSKYGDSEVTVEEINLDPYVDVGRSEQVLDEATEKAQNYAKYVEQIEARQQQEEEAARKQQKKKKFRYLPKSERRMLNRKSKSR